MSGIVQGRKLVNTFDHVANIFFRFLAVQNLKVALKKANILQHIG